MLKPRRPFKFWAMTTVIALFTLVGLLLAAIGPDAENRLAGLIVILFFGVGSIGFLGGPLLTRRGAATVLRQRVQTSAGSEAAFVFPTPAVKRRLTAVAAAGWTAGFVVIIVVGGGVIGVVGAVVFGALLVLQLVGARRPQLLALTPTRVVAHAPAGAVELPWEAVREAAIYKQPAGRTTVDMLGVAATDRKAAVWTRGRMLGRLNRGLSPFDLTVGADTFAGEAEDVVEAIRRYRDDPGRRRSIGGEEEHAQASARARGGCGAAIDSGGLAGRTG